MPNFIYDNAKIIAISMSFFTFGFVLGADVFELAPQERITVLIAGAVCAIIVLMIKYSKSEKQHKIISARLSPNGRQSRSVIAVLVPGFGPRIVCTACRSFHKSTRWSYGFAGRIARRQVQKQHLQI